MCFIEHSNFKEYKVLVLLVTEFLEGLLATCTINCFWISADPKFSISIELHPLRSLVTSVPGHFGPKTELDVQFGPCSLRSLVTSALRTELTKPIRGPKAINVMYLYSVKYVIVA